MGVGHQQPAMPVDREPAGPIDVEIGRAPASQALAIAVEDLDPVGQVGDIKFVLSVKRGDPRLVQPPRLRPVNAPDQLGHARRLDVAAGLEQNRPEENRPG